MGEACGEGGNSFTTSMCELLWFRLACRSLVVRVVRRPHRVPLQNIIMKNGENVFVDESAGPDIRVKGVCVGRG